MKKIRLNNKGYSLVEFIIVIAIIALLSVAGFATVSFISSAKAKEGAVSLESEVTALSNRAKNQMCVYDDGTGVKEHPKAKFILRLYKDSDGSYYVKKGYVDSSVETFVDAENGKDGKGVSLSSYIDIKYDDGTNVLDVSSNSVDIVFDRAGRCTSGYGTFDFYKRNSNRFCKVILNQNGSHRVK